MSEIVELCPYHKIPYDNEQGLCKKCMSEVLSKLVGKEVHEDVPAYIKFLRET